MNDIRHRSVAEARHWYKPMTPIGLIDSERGFNEPVTMQRDKFYFRVSSVTTVFFLFQVKKL